MDLILHYLSRSVDVMPAEFVVNNKEPGFALPVDGRVLAVIGNWSMGVRMDG